MKQNKILPVEIFEMQERHITSILQILSENKLEHWSFNDVLEELRRPDSILLVGNLQEKVISFCISRLIIPNTDFSNLNRFSEAKMPDDSQNNDNAVALTPSDLKINGFHSYESECEIYNIAVSAEFQNRGVGEQILKRLFFMAGLQNVQTFWLEVRSSNRKAINFYRKNHFRQMYERKNFYSNPLESAVVMKRNLSRRLSNK